MSQQPSIPCNLCGSSDSEEIRNKDNRGAYLRSVICRHCGLVWIDPRLSPDEMRAFYEREYRIAYKGGYQPRARQIYRSGKAAIGRFRALRSVLRPGCTVLDVGAGSGEVVYVLRRMGYDASGIEPNEGYARYAADVLGLPVIQGFFQDAAFDAESQDVVTIFHALEHLESPLDMMRKAYYWLRHGGYLLVEVPNVEAVCQWPHTQFHRGHLYHFNLETLGMMGRRAGYTVTQGATSPDGGNITVIFQKSSSAPVEAVDIPENYKRVAGILGHHTGLRHAFTLSPYIRPLRKFAEHLEEHWTVRLGGLPKEMLDALIAKESRMVHGSA